MEWNIRALTSAGHTRSSIKRVDFNCGNKEEYKKLDTYLKLLSWKNHELGIAKAFIACSKQDSKQILGYYSSSMSLIEFPEEMRSGLPGYPLPAMLIGKLAVNKSAQRIGVGKDLLKHAFNTVIDISTKVGVYAITIDAKDEEAKNYYVEKCGFLELKDRDFGLYLPVSIIRKAYEMTKELTEE